MPEYRVEDIQNGVVVATMVVTADSPQEAVEAFTTKPVSIRTDMKSWISVSVAGREHPYEFGYADWLD